MGLNYLSALYLIHISVYNQSQCELHISDHVLREVQLSQFEFTTCETVQVSRDCLVRQPPVDGVVFLAVRKELLSRSRAQPLQNTQTCDTLSRLFVTGH